MKVTVDKEKCIGCMLCSIMAPEIFEMDRDKRSNIKVEEVTADFEELCEDAAADCRTGAIEIEQ